MKKLKSSIDHFTGREREALHGVRKQLTEALQPLLVLYLGSLATTTLRRNLSAVGRHATDFRFSCELLAVLPEEAPMLRDRAGLRALEQRLSARADVRLLVLTPDALAQQLGAGGRARISLHSEAIVLYERDHTLQKIVQQVQAAADEARARKAALAQGQKASAGAADGSVRGLPACLPVGLSAGEHADPLSVMRAFYREYDLPEVRARIAAWLQAVAAAPSWPVAETGLHLDFYVSVCRLLTCAWLLRGCPSPSWVAQQLAAPGDAGMPPQSLYCPHEGADAWAYFPAHLSRAEFGAPGLVFAGLFAERTLAAWLTELYDLFTWSLTDATPASAGEERDLAGVTTQLHRLAEACHLLSVWARRAEDKAPAAGPAPLDAAPSARQAPVTSVL